MNTKNSTKSSKPSTNVGKSSKRKESSANSDKTVDEIYTIAYDIKLKKPGCILLQAALSDIPRDVFYEYFGNTDCWLVFPTPDMAVLPIKRSQLPLLKSKTDFTRG